MTEPSGSMALGHEVKFSDAAYATVAGFLGWTLDAFDYFLVIAMSDGGKCQSFQTRR